MLEAQLLGSAIALATSWIVASPWDPTPCIAFANLLENMVLAGVAAPGMLGRALEAVDEACRRDPGSAVATAQYVASANLAWTFGLLEEESLWQLAERCRVALKLSPATRAVHNALAGVLDFLADTEEGGDSLRDEAESLLRESITFDAGDADALAHRALILARRALAGEGPASELSEARSMLEAAIAKSGRQGHLVANLSWMSLMQGELAEARRTLEEALVLLAPQRGSPALLESLFYAHALWGSSLTPDALRKIRAMLESGVRSRGWSLAEVCRLAEIAGADDSRWHEALARVINDEDPLDVLDDWPAWTLSALPSPVTGPEPSKS